MTDQEGGAVRRLLGPPLLSEKQIGASADPRAEATAAGAAAGRTLAGVGMNVNLAPVLDVYRVPGDFDDQFGRSYSSDPGTVSALGTDFITAQQAEGVAATAKHFPGLGAATSSQNTDEQPVTLSVPRDDLRSIDEYPFQAAIASGVKLVMMSWAVYPALDPRWPAGLSPAIIGGELRQRLGFTGVTITDALEAGALQAFGATGQRATLAASAGMDLILCSGRSLDEGEQARLALQEGLGHGTLSRAAFTAAVERIVSLRSSLRSLLRTPNRMTCGNSGDYVIVEPESLAASAPPAPSSRTRSRPPVCIWSPAVSSPPAGPHAATRTTDLWGS